MAAIRNGTELVLRLSELGLPEHAFELAFHQALQHSSSEAGVAAACDRVTAAVRSLRELNSLDEEKKEEIGPEEFAGLVKSAADELLDAGEAVVTLFRSLAVTGKRRSANVFEAAKRAAVSCRVNAGVDAPCGAILAAMRAGGADPELVVRVERFVESGVWE